MRPTDDDSLCRVGVQNRESKNNQTSAPGITSTPQWQNSSQSLGKEDTLYTADYSRYRLGIGREGDESIAFDEKAMGV